MPSIYSCSSFTEIIFFFFFFLLNCVSSHLSYTHTHTENLNVFCPVFCPEQPGHSQDGCLSHRAQSRDRQGREQHQTRHDGDRMSHPLPRLEQGQQLAGEEQSGAPREKTLKCWTCFTPSILFSSDCTFIRTSGFFFFVFYIHLLLYLKLHFTHSFTKFSQDIFPCNISIKRRMLGRIFPWLFFFLFDQVSIAGQPEGVEIARAQIRVSCVQLPFSYVFYS